jgi:tubulin polyglutamylase TTLL5
MVYASKTGIDIQSYIQRQMTFNNRISGADEAHCSSSLYFRVIKTKEEVYDIITRSFMRKPNWAELPHGISLKTSWNVLWTWSKP